MNTKINKKALLPMAAVTKTLENPIAAVGNLINPQSIHIKSLENSYLYLFSFCRTIKKLRHQPQKQPPRLDVFSIGNSDLYLKSNQLKMF